MNSSTRLYERLGQIPQDPEDPESLDDLIVCAFGAFERYYVCWKNKAGEYRQDGYDLPADLQEWLFPTDGTIRDFATLQVVFGRGNEYFASDKTGKLEYKEPEKKAPLPEELEDKPPLRRSRTVSFLRPLSDASKKDVPPGLDTPPTRRSSNASQSSRPPSLLFLSTRSMSDVSLDSKAFPSRTASESSIVSQSSSHPSSTASTVPSSRPPSDPELKPADVTESPNQDPAVFSPSPTPLRLSRRSRPLSMTFNKDAFPRIPEGKQVPLREPTPHLPPLPPLPKIPTQTSMQTSIQASTQSASPTHCACCMHKQPKPSYANASIQTDPVPSPPRTALRIDTANAPPPPFPSYGYSNTSSAQDIQTPLDEYDYYYPGPQVGGNPVIMGRMLDYYSKPGYQLGMGLMSGYYVYEGPVYDEATDLAAWEAANGKG